MIMFVSFILLYKKDRLAVRERVGDRFVEVYMKILLSVCEECDLKGFYKVVWVGKIKGFIGIDDLYEELVNAEIEMEVVKEDGVLASSRDMVYKIIEYLDVKGFLKVD